MIKFKVTFPEKNDIEKAVMKALKENYTKRLIKVQCPEHHQHPEIVFSGSATNPKIEINGCCQKLIDEAVKALS